LGTFLYSLALQYVWLGRKFWIPEPIHSRLIFALQVSALPAVLGERIKHVNSEITASRFSPFTIIPPMLHTHSFIYQRRFILFYSQYFSSPCQYHSIIAPYSFSIYHRRCMQPYRLRASLNDMLLSLSFSLEMN
jgi:hypothetical protein